MMKIKKNVNFIVLLFAVFFISTLSANAELFNRGTDSLGNRLIYDDDFDITWYDYTNSYIQNGISVGTWQYQTNWASGLTVEFGGTIYDDWRLPSTVDGPYVYGYDGSTTAGYYITSSEMGHLFYTELGNASGVGGFTSTGDFQHLQSDSYWSSTEYATNPDEAWTFTTQNGNQTIRTKNIFVKSAIAVRSGDVAVVPEPISSILFMTGGAALMGRKYIRRKV